MNTTIAREHRSAQIELRRSGQRILVALAAAGLDVAHGQYRLFAGAFAVVRLGNRGGRSLAPVTNHASESIDRVRDYGVLAKRLLRNVGETGFLQTQMAGVAAIHDAQLRQPDLVNARLHAAAQTYRIAAIADQRDVFALITMPLTEVILCRRDGQCQQKDQADKAKCPHRIAEQRPPRRGKIFSDRSHLTPPGRDP